MACLGSCEQLRDAGPSTIIPVPLERVCLELGVGERGTVKGSLGGGRTPSFMGGGP